MSRKPLFALVAVLMGTALALGGAESWSRQQQLPVQVVQATDRTQVHHDAAGMWWEDTYWSDRVDVGCPDPSARTLTLLGSSIFFGSGLEDDESLGVLLSEALDGACVLNQGHPAYSFEQQLARAQATPGSSDVLVWEIWQNSPRRFVHLGDRLVNFGQLATPENPVPDPWGLGPFNRQLMGLSSLYLQAAIARTPRPENGDVRPMWQSFAEKALPEMQALARQRGADLVLVTCPALNRPFVDQKEPLERAYGAVTDAAAAQGIPIVDLRAEFEGLSPEAIGLDDCCHYNRAGTERVARAIAAALTE